MKVDEVRTVGAGRVGRSRAVRGSAEGRAAADGGRTVSDSATVMGIPESELTPKVRSAIMALMDEVAKLRRELDVSNARIAQLERLADEDSLAPVANRRAFVRELSRSIAFSERYGTPSSLLFFDVNGLKAINDTHGHGAGDAALLKVASTLIDNVRTSDFVGRLGGDEFGVILAHADQTAALEKAMSLARTIRDHPIERGGQQISIAMAYGTYTFQGGDSVETALAEADRAMYERKRDAGDTSAG